MVRKDESSQSKLAAVIEETIADAPRVVVEPGVPAFRLDRRTHTILGCSRTVDCGGEAVHPFLPVAQGSTERAGEPGNLPKSGISSMFALRADKAWIPLPGTAICRGDWVLADGDTEETFVETAHGDLWAFPPKAMWEAASAILKACQSESFDSFLGVNSLAEFYSLVEKLEPGPAPVPPKDGQGARRVTRSKPEVKLH